MDIESYLQTQTLPRLHIGCGDNVLPGWLNSDFPARSPAVPELDGTRAYPLRGGTFSYVYSEHMIEHVPYAGGASMLKECHRVLKPGGKIRISTPDLRFLIDLYLAGDRRTALQANYIKWATDTFLIGRGVPGYDPV